MPSLWLGLLIGVVAVTSAAAPMTVDRTAGNLRLEASVPARVFAVGAPIAVSLSVRNTGSAPVTVSFSSGQRYDVIARRPRGDEVWRWSHDKAFIQLVQTVSRPLGVLQSGRPHRTGTDLKSIMLPHTVGRPGEGLLAAKVG